MVNGVSKGEAFVVLSGTEVLVRVADLAEASVSRIKGTRREFVDGSYVVLASLRPAVVYDLNLTRMLLQLTVDPSVFEPTVRQLRQGKPSDLVYTTDTSGFLNYAAEVVDFSHPSLFVEAGVHALGALFFSSATYSEQSGAARGLTNVTIDNPRALMRWVFGDRFAASGPLGGAGLLGGVSVSREFGVDPYYIRFPAVGFAGALSTPGTAEVYVNGRLIRREALPAGPFDLRDVPIDTGRGDVRVVLRDVFGREQITTRPYYFSTGVLKQGLHDYSYNVGFLRENFGRPGDRYATPVLIARHRFGFTDDLTIGGRLETAPNLVTGGSVVTTRLPVGEVEIAAAGSVRKGAVGYAASLGYSFIGRPFGAGVSVRTLSNDYATVGLKPSQDRPKIDLTAFLALRLGSRTSVSLQHSHVELRDRGASDRTSAFVNVRLTNSTNWFVSASRAVQARDTTTELFTGLTFFVAPLTTATVEYERRADGDGPRVEVQKSLPIGSGFGYRVIGSSVGTHDREAALLQYQGPYGRYEAEYDRTDGTAVSRVRAAGAIVAGGSSVFATRPVQDAFAVVRVPGVSGVRTYINNQEAGRTNARGEVAFPDLLSYYGNRISIADEDIPLDYRLGALERLIAPPFRGGALVDFPVTRIQAVSGRVVLRDATAAPTIPAFGDLTVRIADGEVESPIGLDGEFYFENMPSGKYTGVIRFKGKACELELVIPATTDRVIDLGTLDCSGARAQNP